MYMYIGFHWGYTLPSLFFICTVGMYMRVLHSYILPCTHIPNVSRLIGEYHLSAGRRKTLFERCIAFIDVT
ncbi:hypothetical protein AFLA_004083 [Aspergillus flavus NRRL3357]|nr:hypothetical protein AFLA_004083 [Aspergillus flavus NRRL3357]